MEQKAVVMVVKQSAVSDMLAELLDVLAEHNILIRIVKDEDFDIFLKI